MDYLMAPILAGMCQFESLKTGEISLFDIAMMNDALAVSEENQRRWVDYMKDKPGG